MLSSSYHRLDKMKAVPWIVNGVSAGHPKTEPRDETPFYDQNLLVTATDVASIRAEGLVDLPPPPSGKLV